MPVSVEMPRKLKLHANSNVDYCHPKGADF